jgi:hypothetical protein
VSGKLISIDKENNIRMPLVVFVWILMLLTGIVFALAFNIAMYWR